jgi:hypothetical protein
VIKDADHLRQLPSTVVEIAELERMRLVCSALRGKSEGPKAQDALDALNGEFSKPQCSRRTNPGEVVEEAVLTSSVRGDPQACAGEGRNHFTTAVMEASIPDKTAPRAALCPGELDLERPFT